MKFEKFKKIVNADIIAGVMLYGVMFFVCIYFARNLLIQKYEIDNLKTELHDTKAELTNERYVTQAYKAYFKNKPVDDADTLNTVTAMYSENGQYTVIVNKDYFHVDEGTYNSLGIGQEVDTSTWEKAE